MQKYIDKIDRLIPTHTYTNSAYVVVQSSSSQNIAYFKLSLTSYNLGKSWEKQESDIIHFSFILSIPPPGQVPPRMQHLRRCDCPRAQALYIFTYFSYVLFLHFFYNWEFYFFKESISGVSSVLSTFCNSILLLSLQTN